MITELVANARTHLAAWWPAGRRARELARQYKAMQEVCPLAVADLLRASLMFNDVHAPGDDSHTMINIGRRQMGLHLTAMQNLTSEDLEHLRKETDE
jgi:hypothetical protein